MCHSSPAQAHSPSASVALRQPSDDCKAAPESQGLEELFPLLHPKAGRIADRNTSRGLEGYGKAEPSASRPRILSEISILSLPCLRHAETLRQSCS